MQIDVVNTELAKVGTQELPAEVFSAEVKETLLWDEVKAQLARRRRGTACTKRRDEVSGTGAKPLKQKGSGSARQGSKRAPNFVGGGVVMGPKPRDFSYRLPRSARRSALRSALSLRAQEGCLLVLDGFSVDKPATKTVAAFCAKTEGKKVLIVDTENKNLRLSANNLPKAKVLFAEGINVYDILNHDKLVLTQGAIDTVVARATGTVKS